MPIQDDINPSLVDAWFHSALPANATLLASHAEGAKHRFWQEVAVPSVAQGLKWPYIYWQMVPGSKRSTKTVFRSENVIQQTSVWRVWSVRRFTNRGDWAAFNPDIRALREALTGVNCVPVYAGAVKIGNIVASTLYPPEEVEKVDDRDDDIAILSRGIVIRVTHK